MQVHLVALLAGPAQGLIALEHCCGLLRHSRAPSPQLPRPAPLLTSFYRWGPESQTPENGLEQGLLKRS